MHRCPRTSLLLASFALASCFLSAFASAQRPAAQSQPHPRPKVPFPHPLITEVLFDVPKGIEGDANQDGQRSPTGDEFVELINPHDQPINLKGYRLIDGTPIGTSRDRNAEQPTTPKPAPNTAPAKGTQPASSPNAPATDEPAHFAFTFPELVLEPGEVVVVFNGFESAIPAPLGNQTSAPSKHEKFHNAYVFSAQVTSPYAALSNQHDILQLLDPQGNPISTIRWDQRDEHPQRTTQAPKRSSSTKSNTSKDANRTTGKPANREPLDKRAEEAGGLLETLHPPRTGSAQRESATGPLRSHMDSLSTPFSPGQFAPAPAPADHEPTTKK